MFRLKSFNNNELNDAEFIIENEETDKEYEMVVTENESVSVEVAVAPSANVEITFVSHY